MSAPLADDALIDALVNVALYGPGDHPTFDWVGHGELAWRVDDGPLPTDDEEASTAYQVVTETAVHGSHLDGPSFGQLLLNASYAGYNAFYASRDDELPRRYAHVVRERPGLVEALALLDAYEYTAADAPGWSTSAAARACRAIRERLCEMLADGVAPDPSSYAPAPAPSFGTRLVVVRERTPIVAREHARAEVGVYVMRRSVTRAGMAGHDPSLIEFIGHLLAAAPGRGEVTVVDDPSHPIFGLVHAYLRCDEVTAAPPTPA